jgi:glyoxylase-like metal-dependent hydrolase (beta-lactamase superfamily II)
MRKAALEAFAFAILILAASTPLRPAPAGFQKVSQHFFYLEPKTGAANTGAIVTTEGVLLIDPPPEAEIPALQNALKALTTRAVRWVVHTDYQQATAGGWATFLKQGAAIIGSKELDRLASATPPPEPNQPAPAAATRPNPRFLFGQQLHLWPAGIEIRILAVKSKARTAGDVVVFLPSEKVLATGDLFSPFGFPAIDTGTGEGSARGWIDGLKQVIEFVPLLKSAMPHPKQEPPVPAEPEKTLEEAVIVIPGHGAASNMQQMKSLLSAAQRLRTEANRAVAAGRMREDFVKSLPLDVFGEFSNLETFAGQLFDDLSRK